MSNTNKQQQMSCVARGNGFIPVADATYFLHQEPIHTGLFEKIGDEWQPVQNTDTSVRAITCVLRDRLPDVKGDQLYRAIEDVLPVEGETRYIGLFTKYTETVKGGPSMPVQLTCYSPVKVFPYSEGPDHYYGAAARRQARTGRPSIVANSAELAAVA